MVGDAGLMSVSGGNDEVRKADVVSPGHNGFLDKNPSQNVPHQATTNQPPNPEREAGVKLHMIIGLYTMMGGA